MMGEPPLPFVLVLLLLFTYPKLCGTPLTFPTPLSLLPPPPCGLPRRSRLVLDGLGGAGAGGGGGGGLPTPGESVYLFHWPCRLSWNCPGVLGLPVEVLVERELPARGPSGGGGGSSARPLLFDCSVNTVRPGGNLDEVLKIIANAKKT